MFNTHLTGNQDLLSVDIQRGRDVGIPPYTTVRKLCGFPEVNSFEDLLNIIPNYVSRYFIFSKIMLD